MTIKVRKSVFETNSSSSHSLTMGKAELMAQPFPAQSLRQGFITVDLDEYGWEYRRLYTAQNKLSYLLTQLAIGANYGGRLEDFDELRQNDERVERLCRVVKEHTGCDIRIGSNQGGIDHESVGVGVEVFNSDEALKQFLFSEESYIETGNDNSGPPWVINTDKGSQLYYAQFFAEVPDGYKPVKLKPARRYGSGAFYTAKGAFLDGNFNKAMLRKLSQQGVATYVDVKSVGYSHPYQYGDTVQSDWARQLTSGEEGASLKLSPKFDGHCEHTHGEGYETDGTITVMVPAALAKALTALKKTPEVLVELAAAKDRLKHYKKAASEAKKKGEKREDWMTKALAGAKSLVEQLTQKAVAEGVL